MKYQKGVKDGLKHLNELLAIKPNQELVTIRILHDSGSIVTSQFAFDKKRGLLDQTVEIGSALRNADKTVAAVRFSNIQKYCWIGNYSPKNRVAQIQKEREGIDW